jgi:hypothetical protein
VMKMPLPIESWLPLLFLVCHSEQSEESLARSRHRHLTVTNEHSNPSTLDSSTQLELFS